MIVRGRTSLKRRGFTLVELLVVVSVIAILLAIILPSMRSARQSAKRTACGAQLKQIGIGFIAYLDSSNDRLPFASYLPSVDPAPLVNTIYIADVLLPQLNKQNKVLQCPDDKAGRYDRGAPNDNKSYFESEKSSYEYRMDGRPGSPGIGNMVMGHTITEAVKAFEERFGHPIPVNSLYLMRDYRNFHTRDEKSATGARRYLYIDGHVADYEQL
jgi:prepilin-type N-terminal cleavage/methylation domain-containing protein